MISTFYCISSPGWLLGALPYYQGRGTFEKE